jgi:hypothetical protein
MIAGTSGQAKHVLHVAGVRLDRTDSRTRLPFTIRTSEIGWRLSGLR